uniref:X-box-binding protein 1 n=1 Tax=Ornithodoros turicata TaxID=34597 RepID=A0A2R5LAK6_9ACAR
MGVPKRIFIATVSEDLATSSPGLPRNWDRPEEVAVMDVVTTAPVRKRQRLDHLTREEKMLRRKMKNRVAAQCARDRKKARMDELEIVVMTLQAEKEALAEENAALKQRLEQSEAEKERLRERIGNTSSSSIEHASLISEPLQKDQVQLLALSLWMMRSGFLHLMTSLMTYLLCYKSAAKTFSDLPPHQWVRQWVECHRQVSKVEPAMRWWGPHQRNWSPSKR